jgi:riboflavin synthase
MFTGLVERLGRVAGAEPRGEGLRLRISAPGWEGDPAVGDSVAVNGCCLTVVEAGATGLAFDVVPESVRRTTLGRLGPGDAVNLERSMRLDQRVGGHLLQGHVDGVGVVAEVIPEGQGRRITFDVPGPLARYVAEKGAIAIDGVSLTVAACAGTRCEVAFIPHTLAFTVAGHYVPGTAVQIEVDLVARYVARLLEATAEDS